MSRPRTLPLIFLGVVVGACLRPSPPPSGAGSAAARPNFLFVVADDLGYSDLGVYGGEIETPRLDALAESGYRGASFYVAPRGAPTRAMLLTGVDHHIAGIGNLPRKLAPNQEGRPGYEGRLNDRVVTLPSLLRDAGYHTYMAGKWELGADPGSLPAARGFERSFVLHDGAASYWSDMKSAVPGSARARFTADGHEVEELAEGYYSTRFFTDFLIGAIESSEADGKPFFAYLSYQAPHGPFGVPDDWRDRYRGRYDGGFDAIRDARLLRMKRSDLVDGIVQPYPGIPTVPAWQDLGEEQRRAQARKMELYAATVENLDFQLGRLLDYLRESGRLDDTVVVFLSDNGAEPGDRGPAGMDPRDREWYAEQFPESDPENWGRPGSFLEYGPAWAQVSMVPFRLFKGTQAEGGIRSPLIVAGPGVKKRRGFSHALTHVMDLTPTVLDMARVEHSAGHGDRSVAPLQGRSLAPLLAGDWLARHGPHDWLGFELSGDRAIRRGAWKMVWMPPPFGVGTWRLYRIDRDPSELYDRSEQREGEREELLALWEEYVRENGVVLPRQLADPLAESAQAEPPATP